MPWLFCHQAISRYGIAVHEIASRPLVQFDLDLDWASWSWKSVAQFANWKKQIWCQKLGHNVSLKSEKPPNSPNEFSDNCDGMKFDLSDNQSLHGDDPGAHFSRWAKMGVVCNHVRNTAFKLFKSGHTQATVLQSCQSKLLTLNLLTRWETKQLRTNFINNLRVIPQQNQKQNGGCCSVAVGESQEKGFTHEIWWKMKKKCYISATNICAIFQT